MFIKNHVDKKDYNNNGYIVLDTNLIDNSNFNNLVNQINDCLKTELKKNNYLKKMGGSIMGNLNINQGPFASKLYSLVFQEQFINIFEDLTKTKLELFDINHCGNLALPKKGKQLFHIDGNYKKKMYLITIVTENIDLKNGPTEVCVGSHKKQMSYWEFFFSKKTKKKLILNKGQIVIRKHNLWHRGTENKSDTPRLLLSFSLTPKESNIKPQKLSSHIEILPNFFKSSFIGRLHEYFYANFGYVIIILKLIKSIIKRE